MIGDVPFNVFAQAISRAQDQPQHHAPLARDRLRVVHVQAVRARGFRARRSCPTRTKGSSAGSTSARSCASSRMPTKRLPRIASYSTIPARRRRWDAVRASVCSTSTPTRTALARSSSSSGCSRTGGRRVAELAAVPAPPRDAVLAQLGELRRIAIVPALNEEESVGRVIDEIRAFDPGFDIVVVDDGSTDRTAGIAADRGAHVLRLPFNLGIGGAVQTGYRFAFERGYDVAVQVDGDGQHDAAQLPTILEPVLTGAGRSLRRLALCCTAVATSRPSCAVSGSRSSRRSSPPSLRQKVTDTTSGFRAVNRKGIALFAADYPARLSGGRGDDDVREAQAAPARGAGRDARARQRRVVDHRSALRSTT